MPLSGLMMYGASQKNKFIMFPSIFILTLHLYLSSAFSIFFLINLSVILIVCIALGKTNIQMLSGCAILVYSIMIDIIFFFIFPVGVGIGEYIIAGIIFNLRAVLLPIIISVAVTLAKLLDSNVKKQSALYQSRCK